MEKEPTKRRRGRPRKNPVETPATTNETTEVKEVKKRKKRVNKIAEMAKDLASGATKVVEDNANEQTSENATENQPVKRRRGRPRKNPVEAPAQTETAVEAKPKKRRGRPRKNPVETPAPAEQTKATTQAQPAKRRRGRPRKNPIEVASKPATKTVAKPNTIKPTKTKAAEQSSLEILVEAINNLTREVKILRRHLNK